MQPGFESATDERTRQLRIDRLVDGGKPAPTDLPHRGKPAERGRERGLIRHSLTAVAILRADLVEQEKQIDLGVVDRVGSGFSPLIRRRSPPDQAVIERCQPIGIGAGLFRLWSGPGFVIGMGWLAPLAIGEFPQRSPRYPGNSFGARPMPCPTQPASGPCPPSLFRGCPSIALEP